MEVESVRTKPVAVFMAFGTKGDIYPIAAIAVAFAGDQSQYDVVLITHSAHENLRCHLAEKHVSYLPISSPPVLSIHPKNDPTGAVALPFSLQKRMFSSDHRQECYLVVESVFGSGPSMEGDFIVINFFALEGWSIAELFRVRCMVAAPYVVPYSAPSSFERHFKKELPFLYKYLKEADISKVCWKDVIHWMWPLFTEYWGSWRCDNLNMSPCPFTDPVTGLPTWHDRPPSPLLLYGFSKEVVECPGYWPSKVRVCGYWFLPNEWQFSCKQCCEISRIVSSGHLDAKDELCSAHVHLEYFLKTPMPMPPVFIGLSSIGSMGFLKNPQAFLRLLQTVVEITGYRFILFTAGYVPLDTAIRAIAAESSYVMHKQFNDECLSLFNDRLFCFSGTIPYKWLFTRCAAAIHHGGRTLECGLYSEGEPLGLLPSINRSSIYSITITPYRVFRLKPQLQYSTSIPESCSATQIISILIPFHRGISHIIEKLSVTYRPNSNICISSTDLYWDFPWHCGYLGLFESSRFWFFEFKREDRGGGEHKRNNSGSSTDRKKRISNLQ